MGCITPFTRVLSATWQRCRVHWIRNALAHVRKGQHAMVAAAIRPAFLPAEAEAAHRTWRHVVDQFRPRWPKLAALIDENEHDVLACMTFPGQHRTKLHSTNPLQRRVHEHVVANGPSKSRRARLPLDASQAQHGGVDPVVARCRNTLTRIKRASGVPRGTCHTPGDPAVRACR